MVEFQVIRWQMGGKTGKFLAFSKAHLASHLLLHLDWVFQLCLLCKVPWSLLRAVGATSGCLGSEEEFYGVSLSRVKKKKKKKKKF